MSTPPPLFDQHPERADIQAEAHARPPLPIDLEVSEVWQWVIVTSDEAKQSWPSGIDPSRSYQILKLSDGVLRFEHHTEFVSLTFLGETRPNSDTLTLVGQCSGLQIAGSRVVIRPQFDHFCAHLFSGPRLYGGQIDSHDIEVATDFQVGADTMVNYTLTGTFRDKYHRGVLAKQVIDLEMYRIAALMGLPEVRRHMPELVALEKSAAEVTQHLGENPDAELGSIITEVSETLARVAVLRETLRYRIAASKAYESVVQARLRSLSEAPLKSRPTLQRFVAYRLTPATNTIMAFDRRLSQLDRDVHQTMSLARTKLDFFNQKQNAKVLQSMETRARQQVHLAQAVEGLSVAAITYYTVGLFSYVLKGLPEDMQFATPQTALAISIPIIGATVWWFTRKARKAIDKLSS